MKPIKKKYEGPEGNSDGYQSQAMVREDSEGTDPARHSTTQGLTLPWDGMGMDCKWGSLNFINASNEFDDCCGKAYLSGDIDREISLSIITTLKAVLYQ